MSGNTRAQAVKRIQDAFAATPAPALEGDWHDWYDCEDLKTRWAGKHWRDITAEMIFPLRECLSHLRPDVFRFYLPAHLIGVLLHPDKVDTLTSSIVKCLAPSVGQPDTYAHNQRLEAQSQAFTKTEVGAVLVFFETYELLYDTTYLRKYRREFRTAVHYWKNTRDKINRK